jgi:hypothetical protein
MKVRKSNIACEPHLLFGLPATAIQAESDDEWRLVAKDREIKATQDARNSLESYVYAAREKLSDASSKYVSIFFLKKIVLLLFQS